MALFAVTYTYVDDAETVDANRPPHVAFLNGLSDAGLLRLSGPLANDGPAGALLIFETESGEELAKTLDGDPFMALGLIEKRTIRQWNIRFGAIAE